MTSPKLDHSFSTISNNVREFNSTLGKILPSEVIRLLIIVACCLWLIGWILTGFANFKNGSEVTIDGDWNIAIAASWEQGHVIGRDSFFTYGPLVQAVASFANKFNLSGSAFNGRGLILVSLRILSVLSFGLVLSLLKQLSWKYIIFLTISLTFLRATEAGIFFRFWFVAACIIGLSYLMKTRQRVWQLLGIVLIGVASAFLQLFTFEMGLYAIATGVGLVGGYALLSAFPKILKKTDLLPVKSYLWMGGALVSGYALGNIAISLVFKLTSPNYRGFFDYQRQSFDMARGYNNTFGFPWTLGWLDTITLGLILLYCVWYVLRYLAELEIGEGYLLSGLLILGLIQSKSATLRSDDGHIYYGMTGLIFLFFLLGHGWSKTRRQNPIWLGLVLAIIITAPQTNFNALREMDKVLNGQTSLSLKIKQAVTYNVPKSEITPVELLQAADPQKAISVFPYEYHLLVPFEKPIVSPSLQAYVALTEPLQLAYVAELARHKDKLEVIYGLDKVVSGAIDNVYNITRLPRIFEYLYQNFELKTYSKGYMLLQPSTPRTDMQSKELHYKLTKVNDQLMTLSLTEPASCSLLRLTPKIKYPFWQSLGRPNGLSIKVWAANQVIENTDMVTIKPGEAFSTYLPLVEPANFVQVFGKGPVQTKNWDGLQINYRTSGLFGVDPATVEFQKIECITFER